MADNFTEAKIKMPRNRTADPNILQARILLIPTEKGVPPVDPKNNAKLLAQCLMFIDKDVLAELPAAIFEALAQKDQAT